MREQEPFLLGVLRRDAVKFWELCWVCRRKLWWRRTDAFEVAYPGVPRSGHWIGHARCVGELRTAVGLALDVPAPPQPDLPLDREADWLVLGMPGEGEESSVVLMACDPLSGATMNRKIARIERIPISRQPGAPVAKVPVHVTRLVVDVEKFVQVYGKSYQTAFPDLMREWRNLG